MRNEKLALTDCNSAASLQRVDANEPHHWLRALATDWALSDGDHSLLTAVNHNNRRFVTIGHHKKHTDS